MLKRDISQLAIVEVNEETETLPLERLRRLYLEKTSEIIYVTKEKKLYGIICMGEVLYEHKLNSEVRINKAFTSLTGCNMAMARHIFAKKSKVNKIPVVNDRRELIGDYSRWDDALYIERNHALLMNDRIVRQILSSYENVYIVEPVKEKDIHYLQLIKYMDYFHIEYAILNKEQLGKKLSERAICILLDEDEKMGMQCLYGVEPRFLDVFGNDIRQYDVVAAKNYRMTLTTYKNLLLRIKREGYFDYFRIDKPFVSGEYRSRDWFFYGLNYKASVLLSELEKRGVKCFCLHTYADEKTEYGKKFYGEIAERVGAFSSDPDELWIKQTNREEFYEELYCQEEYKQEKAQGKIAYLSNIFEYRKNINSKYFNSMGGRRKTCGQPKEYIGTIYLLGMCIMIGPYVEDQYTVASYLQQKLLEKGYLYRVENCGSMMREDGGIDVRLAEIDAFQKNDIVLYQSTKKVMSGIECDSLEEIFEKNNIPSGWVVDGYLHCNHKANKIIADNIFGNLEPYLLSQESVNEHKQMIQFNLHDVMKDYIQHNYLFQYSNIKKDGTVGAIIMQCDPFHKGHRYLIEQAKERVDFLIVFLIDKENSMFSFEERFKMLEEGTKDIENIKIIPNGDFVCSRDTFPELHLQKRYIISALELNAKYDSEIFGEYIAEAFHITYRFAGEEPEGRVKTTYYKAAKELLPMRGIKFLEIPRLAENGESISTSRIQEYLKREEYDRAFSLVPESTRQYLAKQLEMAADTLL